MASAVHHSNSTQPYVWHDEFYIGPPSQPVDIANFLSSAVNTSPRNVLDPAQEIDGDALATRCSVDNLKEELDQLLSLPDVSGYIKRRQNMAAQRLFDLAQGHTEGSDEPKGRATKSRKRERSEEHNESESLVLSAGASDPVPEVAYVREELERLNLQMNASLSPQARHFVRRPRMADQNSLKSVMDRTMQAIDLRDESEMSNEEDGPDVVISISVYTAHSVWPNGLRVSSMHDLLASNTLADLMRAIPCQSAAIPNASKRIHPEIDLLDRAYVGMEDMVYGPQTRDQVGSSQLLSYLNAKKPGGMKLRSSAVALESVRLGSLTLRMNYPYWIFHAGICEHIWTVDDIHLHHNAEPDHAEYPLTTFLPVSTTPNCGICKTLPAVIAVSSDIRLAESPCLVCKSCWDVLGWPRGDEEIKAVRLIGPRTT